MQKLLIPVDGSSGARNALVYAIGLAKEHGDIELHIVTVHPEPAIYGELQVYAQQEAVVELQRIDSFDFLQPAIDAAKWALVPCTSEVLVGNTALMIARRAKELNCTAIVMGTRGMGAVGNLVLGSVATRVVHLTSLPVTLVK
jgi:nucleotide-binding universal stress UspA family protein